jgi:2-phosphosulfolactate phosphatase
MTRVIDVCFSPDLYHLSKNDEAIVVVIDVLRATSAICTAFETGVDRIIPVATLKDAENFKLQGYIVGAERDGAPVDGFDFGNSPYSYKQEVIINKTIVITTTNGTQAIQAAKDAHKLVIGAFVNISALCNWLAAQERDIVLLCSGWKGKYNLEDSLFAGAVVDRLTKSTFFSEMTDSALSSKYLFQTAANDPYLFLRNSSHRRRLAKLNLKQDIKYCLTPDQTTVIPVYENGYLVRLEV